MASMKHEVLVELFRNRPTLAAELLVEVLHIEVPKYEEARLASIDLTNVQPAEYRADAVIVLYYEDKPVGVNIVEVQLSPDPDKRFSWPSYLTDSRARFRCPADLLVIAPDAYVAEWCSQPIEIGVPGFVLTPPVLQRKLIPVVVEVTEAARRPELAVLSAMAYGDRPEASAIVRAIVPVLEKLEAKRSTLYHDLVYNAVNEAARRAMEAMMIKGYEYTSPFAKKFFEAHEEGHKEGHKEGTARAVLGVMSARGLIISEATRQRVLSEKDPARLDQWLERAAVASSLAEIFDDLS